MINCAHVSDIIFVDNVCINGRRIVSYCDTIGVDELVLSLD